MTLVIGVDMGGTNLRAGIVEMETGRLFALQSTPTLAREGQAAVMERLAGLIDSLMKSAGIPRSGTPVIGIGVPGVLDIEHGIVLFLPNLPGNWPHVPLGPTISERTGLPVFILNDVRSITYGEFKFGAGRGVETMACFAIGTGVGGGLVINGRLHLGIGGTGGELGHQTIDMNGPACGCGNRGCLEAFASGPAIAAMGVKAVIQGLTTSIGEQAGYDLNKITPDLICEAARHGDAVANEIYARAGTYIGIAISNVLVCIGPRKVVLTGGVAAAGDLLLDPIRRTVKERVTVMPADQVEIVPAALGGNAGVIGVAHWAAERLSQMSF
jgi:glucokinase